jgi:hypothetical protein
MMVMRAPGLNYEASTAESENVQSSLKTEPSSAEAGLMPC